MVSIIVLLLNYRMPLIGGNYATSGRQNILNIWNHFSFGFWNLCCFFLVLLFWSCSENAGWWLPLCWGLSLRDSYSDNSSRMARLFSTLTSDVFLLRRRLLTMGPKKQASQSAKKVKQITCDMIRISSSWFLGI